MDRHSYTLPSPAAQQQQYVQAHTPSTAPSDKSTLPSYATSQPMLAGPGLPPHGVSEAAPHHANPQGSLVYMSAGPTPSAAVTYYLCSEPQAPFPQQHQSLSMPSIMVSPPNVTTAAPPPAGPGFYVLQSYPPSQQPQQQQYSPMLLNANAAGAGVQQHQPFYVMTPQQHMEVLNATPMSAFAPSGYHAAQHVQLTPALHSANAQLLAYVPGMSALPHPPAHGMPTMLYAGGGLQDAQAVLQQQQQLYTAANARQNGSMLAVDAGAHAGATPTTHAPHEKTRGGKQRRNTGSGQSASLSSTTTNATAAVAVAPQGLPYDEDPVEIDVTKRQLIVNYLPQRLTDERFKDLFRPYGELLEEESHIIYDFRHHKTVPLQAPVKGDPAAAVAAAMTNSTTSDSRATLRTEELGAAAATEDSIRTTTTTTTTAATPGAVTLTRSVPRSKGYGFIYYKDGASTERAIKELNGKEVDGKRIKVRYAQQQRLMENDGTPSSSLSHAPVVEDEMDVQLHSVTTDSDDSDSDDEEVSRQQYNLSTFKVDEE